MMRVLEQLKETLCMQLEEYAGMRELAGRDLEAVHQLTDTIKNIHKILMAEEEGYSQAGDWEAEMRGNYGRESSYARRGMHYVRGHYSREGEGSYDSGNSERGYSSRRRYSRAEGKESMVTQLREMMEEAGDEKEKEAIRRCISQMEKG